MRHYEPDASTIRELIELRRELHAHPEPSSLEESTAATVRAYLERYQPDELISGIGGHGLMARFGDSAAGPRVMIRADLDALPIQERSQIPHRSRSHPVAHLCGHDGHMATVAGLAPALARRRLRNGQVWLLFQPAEETGQGARLTTTFLMSSSDPGSCFFAVLSRRRWISSNEQGRGLAIKAWCSQGAMGIRTPGRRPARRWVQIADSGSAEAGAAPAVAVTPAWRTAVVIALPVVRA